MPWNECNVVEDRLRFIARLLDGEKMAGLCREFGRQFKSGYQSLVAFDVRESREKKSCI